MSFKVRVLEVKRSFPNAKHIFGSRDRRPAIAKKKTQKKISRKHNKHPHDITGLRYEDLFNESEPAVAMAIARLSPKEREERDMRLRRALDLDFKKTTLPEEVRSLLLLYKTQT